MNFQLDDLRDLEGGCLTGDYEVYDEMPDYPAEIELMGVLDDAITNQEIDLILDEAELMGVDLDDPELMGFFLKKLINKIKSRFKKKKKGAPSPMAPTSITMTTPAGVAKVGPGGVSFTGKRPLAITPTGAIVAAPPQPTGIQAMLKNPAVLIGGGAGLLILFMMMQKKKGKRK